MGCGTSKPKVCQNCQEPFSPMHQRSKSMHVHHLPRREIDNIHRVSFTSTTFGSLRIDPLFTNQYIIEELAQEKDVLFEEDQEKKSKEEFSVGMIEAKIWSEMIDEKINKVVPKTPNRTPPGEPETINTWELMEGLEDTSPLRPLNSHHFRSFSFQIQPNQHPNCHDQPTPKVQENGDQGPKPIWMEKAENDSESVDPEVISTFRKALEDLPPTNPFHLKPMIIGTGETLMKMDEELDDSEVNEESWNSNEVEEYESETFRVKEKLVLYFTSLRGVRKTYTDCCYVRVILKGLGVKIDERDVSMHSGFKEELKELLGELYPGGGLPNVFIGAKYIGGAEEIRRMNDAGQLEKLVENCERAERTSGENGGDGDACEACGDIRFVPCDTCSGSCKIYNEGEFDEENEEDEYGFQRCQNCNENGLIRCPICCD